MVIGIGTSLLALGLAGPTGLAFGYGYGYGVRQGYSEFKPQPGKVAMGLKQSPNPITGGLGMGLQSGQERTGFKELGLSRPSIQENGKALTNIQRYSKFQEGGYEFPTSVRKRNIRRR